MVRKPAVSGQFYPDDKSRLLKDLEKMVPDSEHKVNAIGAVVPHAGYVYSGGVAGEVYARLKPKKTYIILSPNHTGCGTRFAALDEDWRTPLGSIGADKELLEAMMQNTDLIEIDPAAHMFEHSVEVQLPFIQMISRDASIVPITIRYGDMSEYEEVSGAIVSAVEGTGRDVTIVASSDMTHYEPRESAAEKDQMAIRKIIGLDPKGLLTIVREKDISMCGYIPVVIMLMCAVKMKAKKAELVKYADSGDVTGDTEQVVGYAGIIVY
ncbi:MAG: AmmeMemoRadiSam system protein B [Candidatus Omnitrophota bacterium]